MHSGLQSPDNIFLVALPFQLFGVKYIFDHHDANPELYLSKYERRDALYKAQVWLEEMTYRFSDVVMATNESYRSLAIERGRRDAKDVFVVRNGPDLDKFRLVPAQPSLKHGKQWLVGYVGTMSIQEGLDILIDVAAYIREMGRADVHFTCVGGGPGLQGLRQLVTQKGLENFVDFTGRVPDSELLDILSTADVCVNPDKPCEMNDISTMIKIAEYMALGKPIVQFDLKEGRATAGMPLFTVIIRIKSRILHARYSGCLITRRSARRWVRLGGSESSSSLLGSIRSTTYSWPMSAPLRSVQIKPGRTPRRQERTRMKLAHYQVPMSGICKLLH